MHSICRKLTAGLPIRESEKVGNQWSLIFNLDLCTSRAVTGKNTPRNNAYFFLEDKIILPVEGVLETRESDCTDCKRESSGESSCTCLSVCWTVHTECLTNICAVCWAVELHTSTSRECGTLQHSKCCYAVYSSCCWCELVPSSAVNIKWYCSPLLLIWSGTAVLCYYY